ncbi:MFS general substrate transporter [Trichodelitschia bisporula]|uniref:MFS general substrate transporter n=1 Tax=Trichodelitschia bisporula TaxID=703511 RepID=A0A6G1I9H1_9PEZI|nr:MFS general substrate transporter [Trichodelitschia bisporula]
MEKGSKQSTDEEVELEPVVTAKTWVVVFILSMGYGFSFVPVPVMAAVGPNIAADFGEPTSYVWYVSAWIVSITICFMIAGANTDLLGRRWFLIAGNLICCVGHLIVGNSQNAATLIAGMAVTGFGAALCQMATFALTELLPNKWRHIGVVLADAAVYVTITLIPVTARYGYYVGDWRGNFYASAICQALSCLGLYLLYYPPAHPLGIPFGQVFREMDYLGMFLFIAGSLPVLLGIVWVSVYPSTDAHVVAPLVVGFIVLAVFACYETFGNAKHPLTPPSVFTSNYGREFTAPCIALAIINMFYYSASIIWPTMIAVFYVSDPTDWRRASVLSLPQGLAITLGGVLLSIFGSKIRHWQWQQTVAITVMVIFGSLMALGNKDNMGMMIAFLFLSLVGYGWSIYLCIAITQMGVKQEQLGISGGLSGCVRFAGGTIAQAVYLAVQTNTVTKWVGKLVPKAAMAAGVAESDLPNLLPLVGTAELAAKYPANVAAAVFEAYQEATRHGLQLIAYVSLAFGIVGIIASLCCADVDHKMTNKIEVYLENSEFADRNKFH